MKEYKPMILLECKKFSNTDSIDYNGQHITKYLAEDGNWYTVKELITLIPANKNGEKLSVPALYSRLNSLTLSNPRMLDMKQTDKQRAVTMRTVDTTNRMPPDKRRRMHIENIPLGKFDNI